MTVKNITIRCTKAFGCAKAGELFSATLRKRTIRFNDNELPTWTSHPSLFLNEEGKPLSFWHGGRDWSHWEIVAAV